MALESLLCSLATLFFHCSMEEEPPEGPEALPLLPPDVLAPEIAVTEWRV